MPHESHTHLSEQHTPGPKDFCLNTPSRARSLLGQPRYVRRCLLPPASPPPPLACRALRRLGRPHSRGGVRVGALLGRVPRVSVGAPAVWTATAGLGALLPGPPPARCDCPSVRAGPRVRGRWSSPRAAGHVCAVRPNKSAAPRNLTTTDTPSHTHRDRTTGPPGDAEAIAPRPGRAQAGITDGSHRIAPTPPNISRQCTRTNLRAARQSPRSPASASPYAGRPLRRARRRQGWRRAPGSA